MLQPNLGRDRPWETRAAAKVPRRTCWQIKGTRWMCHMMVECRKPARCLWEVGRLASALARLHTSICTSSSAQDRSRHFIMTSDLQHESQQSHQRNMLAPPRESCLHMVRNMHAICTHPARVVRACLRCSSSRAARYCAVLRRPDAGSMPNALMLLSSSSSISPCIAGWLPSGLCCRPPCWL